ncbi:MAG: nucleoside triphosphate pyrophosphohydrolase family protein [Patescibacteria group bacterium]
MDFDEYQKLAGRTAMYAKQDKEFILMYLCMGIAGEGGEVIEKIKKVIRNDGGAISNEKRQDLKKEIGDVLWYLSQLSGELDVPFGDVAEANIKKLADRQVRGVIKSEGDTR